MTDPQRTRARRRRAVLAATLVGIAALVVGGSITAVIASAQPSSPGGASRGTSPLNNSVAASAPARHPAGCTDDHRVAAPLLTYGDLDAASLQLNHPGTAHARLCAVFGERTGHEVQTGSAGSEPGSLTFLFRVINTHKANGAGGRYYWVAGAVDRSVAAVHIWFPDEHTGSTRLPLVSLGSGWQGFAYEYSPPPTLGRPPPEPSVVFTARSSTGAVVDSRRLYLDTGRSRRSAGPSTGSEVALSTG